MVFTQVEWLKWREYMYSSTHKTAYKSSLLTEGKMTIFYFKVCESQNKVLTRTNYTVRYVVTGGPLSVTTLMWEQSEPFTKHFLKTFCSTEEKEMKRNDSLLRLWYLLKNVCNVIISEQ